ncbi:T9SS type A sorting domain-containing protein [bacterium]|nr:T9SS type A sorting domain-containing protein [bacterium]MBU1938082.1 T9SS type A sorting domain-containing protein [bacterium]
MNCIKFLGVVFFVILTITSVKALELEELWEVTLPEGQTYLRANTAWAPFDSLPYVFYMGTEDRTIYHFTPGQAFEPLITLPDYPLGGIECFGVCLDSTWESSMLVYFRNIAPDTGRVQFANLQSGDSIHAIDVITEEEYEAEGIGEARDMWWHPGVLYCTSAENGMVACLSGNEYDWHYWYEWFSTRGGYHNRSRMMGWSARNFENVCTYHPYRPGTQAYCLLGTDAVPDFAISGSDWGFWEVHDRDNDWGMNFTYRGAKIYFSQEEIQPYTMNSTYSGTVMALERADGPAWGMLFFCQSTVSYYVQGPTLVWSVPLQISNPIHAAAFPRRIIPQRVALIYSSSGMLTEVDLAGGRIGETVDFPASVRTLQPYLGDNDSWDLMAVFDNKVRGYSVSGLLPIEENHEAALPETYSLEAFPNPFNSTIKITYEIPKVADVRLRIMNILGREAATLVSASQIPGKHDITWNADGFSSGIYFACLEAGNETLVKKLVLLK